MAYTRKNWLKRAVDIQNIWRTNHKQWDGNMDGTTIYRRIIAPRFHLSKSAMYEYLGEKHPEQQLHNLEEADKKQMKLF